MKYGFTVHLNHIYFLSKKKSKIFFFLFKYLKNTEIKIILITVGKQFFLSLYLMLVDFDEK